MTNKTASEWLACVYASIEGDSDVNPVLVIQRAMNEAAKAERKRCAAICRTVSSAHKKYERYNLAMVAIDCAHKIEALGVTE